MSTGVLECLGEIAAMYGEQVALVQYVGHVVECIGAAAKLVDASVSYYWMFEIFLYSFNVV